MNKYMILAKPLWGTIHEWSQRHNVALHYTMALSAHIVVIIFVCMSATLKSYYNGNTRVFNERA